MGGRVAAVCRALTATIGLVAGCDSSSTTSLYQVAGTVTTNGAAEPGVEVVIDEAVNWTERTDENGRFAVDDVPAGPHALALNKTYDPGNFSELTVQLEVTSDIDLESLELPEPIVLAEPMVGDDDRTILLSWEATAASDFREYRVYAHDSAGLDETTGELIFVGTDRAGTEFVHQPIDAGQAYFYRVFVMNDVGRLGGSNIVSVTAPIFDLVLDGGFEEPGSLDNWNHDGSLPPELVNDVVHGGEAALELDASEEDPCCRGNYLDTTYRINLVEGKTYQLSAWMKARGTQTDLIQPSVWLVRNAGSEAGEYVAEISTPYNSGGIPGPYPDSDWAFYSRVFMAPEGGLHHIRILGSTTEFWIDELSLVPRP